jgi:hypothetical protein
MSSSQIGMTTIDIALYVCLIIHSKEILLGQEEHLLPNIKCIPNDARELI